MRKKGLHMNRRQFLTNFSSCSTDASLGAKYFTNAVFRTHENKEVRFYDDLIKGKHVVINFMYANCQGTCPRITANLAKAQEALKHRIGQDIFMYSITIKPEEDNPSTLREYAKMHQAKPGWLFLTADPYDIATVRSRITNWSHPGIDLDATQHTGMIRVLNDSINRWFGCSGLASQETIVQVIKWCEPIKPLDVRIRENAIAQAKIDQMEVLPTWLGSLGDS
jgi:protein SCO1/2